MSFIFKFCSQCGRKFVQHSDDDCVNLCQNCNQGSVGMEINDSFSPEEVRKIMMGPNGENNQDEMDISDIDDFEDFDDEDCDYQEFDEPSDFDDEDFDD